MDRIIRDVCESPEDSERKKAFHVELVNPTAVSFRNKAKRPAHMSQSSILVDTVDNSPFVKIWLLNLSW